MRQKKVSVYEGTRGSVMLIGGPVNRIVDTGSDLVPEVRVIRGPITETN